MSKKNTGKDYEILVCNIYKTLLDLENSNSFYKRTDVQHDIKLLGKSGLEHQIDVYWEFVIAGTKYITIIQAKDWNSTVKKEHVMTFKSVMDDIPGCSKGIFVSKSGFQKGAVEFARFCGIELVQIKDMEQHNLNVLLEHTITHYRFCNLHIDEKWLSDKKEVSSFENKYIPIKSYDEVFLLSPLNYKVLLYDILCKDATPYYNASPEEIHKIEKKFEGSWFWLTEDNKVPMVKITGYDFVCVNTVHIHEFSISNMFDYLITTILTGEKTLYNSSKNNIKKVNGTEVI